MATMQAVHSDYLVERYLGRGDENMFNHVKFRLVADALQESGLDELRILDLGCADRLAERYLSELGVEFEYCGVDYESPFGPDICEDIRRADAIRAKLPWQPNVILLLDVLEHLEGQQADIVEVLQACQSILGSGGIVVVTVPQMYRLDRFQFGHLHYPEHKIRLRQRQWRDLLASELGIRRTQGVGFLSVLPYLLMLSPRYEQQPRLMRAFKRLRERTIERTALRRLDWHATRLLGGAPGLRQVTNDILFICEVTPEETTLRVAA